MNTAHKRKAGFYLDTLCLKEGESILIIKSSYLDRDRNELFRYTNNQKDIIQFINKIEFSCPLDGIQ